MYKYPEHFSFVTVLAKTSAVFRIITVLLNNTKMLPLLLLLVTGAIAENCSFFYDDMYYSRQAILTIKGLPTNLVYNPTTHDLLFTLIDLDTLQDDSVQTKMDQYILRNGEPIKVDNVNGQAAAIDIKRNKVFIASDDGLNFLNKTDKAQFYSLKDEDIVQLFRPKHGDDLYAVIFPDNEVYKINLKLNEKKRVDGVPCALILAVDSEDNVFYECDSKYVKLLLKDFQEPIEFVGIGKNTARAITVDDNNRVVLATNDGLYQLKSDNLIPKKLMNLDFIPSGVVINEDDIYLSTSGIIYKYSNEHCENEVK